MRDGPAQAAPTLIQAPDREAVLAKSRHWIAAQVTPEETQ
jgi:hypothetical protein